ncbi:TIGR01906 family membrane protein [Streptococcus orisasini]
MKAKLHFALTVLFLLSFSILATIYLVWLFYPVEISWLHLEKIVFMKSRQIQHNFNILMVYLTSPFHWQLTMPDFPSSKDGLHHFKQVKVLFHLAQASCLLTLPSFLLFMKNVIQKGYGLLYKQALKIAALIPILLTMIAAVIGFDSFFTLFHQVLFAGDETWLFNPYTDSVIYILPETFFLHCFILFLLLYELSFAALLWQIRKKQDKRSSRQETSESST